MKAVRILLGCALVLALSATSRANLITNGDFSNGEDGSFASNDTFVPNNTQNLTAGIYSVGTDAQAVNSFYTDPVTITPNNNTQSVVPAGNYLFVDGTTVPTTSYAETIGGLVNGATYTFSGYVATLFAANPAILEITLGSQTLYSGLNAPATTGSWSGFQTTFVYTGPTGPALLNIQSNQSAPLPGNDFALDSLALNASAVPEPASVVLFGAGLAGFGLAAARRYRRRQAA